MTGEPERIEWPHDFGQLSEYAMDQAFRVLGDALRDHPDEDVRRALATVRLVERMPRSAPWYGMHLRRPEGGSVMLGTVLHNAFEALGDCVDCLASGGGLSTKADSWFTRHYMAAWRQGRQDDRDFLRHLLDPLRWEAEREARRLSDEQARAGYAHARRLLDGPPGGAR